MTQESASVPAVNHNWDAFRLHAKWVAKSAIWAALNRHRSNGKPDIWIFGSRRSGSTLLMQTISRNAGVKFSDHPFSVRSVGLYDLRLLQTFENGPYLEIYPELEQELRSYVSDMRSGRLHVNEPSFPWRAEFKFRSDRIVFKATDILHIAGWVETNFPSQVIFLVRHPLSQAISTLRNKWLPRYRAYLSNRNFVETYLSPAGFAKCREIADRGTPLQQHVLTWCCENVVLCREMDRFPARGFLPYEDMVERVDDVISALGNAYDLPNTDGMKQALQAPSSSTFLSTGETRGAIREGKTDELLSRWRKQVSAQEEADAFGILDLFGMDLYRRGEELPRIRMRLPPNTKHLPEASTAAISSAGQ